MRFGRPGIWVPQAQMQICLYVGSDLSINSAVSETEAGEKLRASGRVAITRSADPKSTKSKSTCWRIGVMQNVGKLSFADNLDPLAIVFGPK